MKAIYAPPFDMPTVLELVGDPLMAMREVLECQIVEGLEIGHEGAKAWGDEEAKLVNWPCPYCGRDDPRGKPENRLATLLVYGEKEEAKRRQRESQAEWERAGFVVMHHDTGDSREPFVAGPILITGIDRRTGEMTDVPDDLIEAITKGAAHVKASDK